MSDFTLTAYEKRELGLALIQRFRAGEFGPITFRMEMRKLGYPEIEIDAWRNTFIDECAAKMRGQK